MDVEIRVDRSGPLFDGRADRAVADYLDEVKWEVGSQGLSIAHDVLDARIKQPTPYYETQIMVERAGDSVVAHDRDIVYGRWLEGVSEKNRSTRFKGYRAFRTAAAALNAGKARELAEYVLRRFLGRMQ